MEIEISTDKMDIHQNEQHQPIMSREGRRQKAPTKLNPNGNIPKGEQCPFHNKCGHVDTTCSIGHDVTKNEMSCALARAFDMIS